MQKSLEISILMNNNFKNTKTILAVVFLFEEELKKVFYCVSLIFLIFITVTIYTTDFSLIFSMPSSFYINLEEVDQSNKNQSFGEFISLELGKETSTSSNKSHEKIITFKLFGFIPVRKIVAKILPEEDVYVGGNPVGISILSNDGIVVSESEFGKANMMNIERIFKEGDLIYKINGNKIQSLNDISHVIETSKNGRLIVEYYRNEKPHKAEIKAVKNKDGVYEAGITVKDDISGIGTLTYINSKTGSFGALGHQICDNAEKVRLAEGDIYDCKLLGIDKGKTNNPGQLKGVFVEGKGQKGKIIKSNKFGIYGKINDFSIVDTNVTAKLGGRLSVKPGKAKIISSISGIKEEYDIEIIKAYHQTKEKEKSFVFRVIDKRLISLTGGIVQGMSGSPIVQNGKIIGAVTHVFTVDPTKGYGLYTDWMVENNT